MDNSPGERALTANLTRMGSPKDLDGRVRAVETQMREVRQSNAETRVLAQGADRDVSAFGARLDAHLRLLEALRETQIEHGERLSAHDQRFDRLESEMRRGFSTLAIGQAEILALLRRSDDASGDGA